MMPFAPGRLSTTSCCPHLYRHLLSDESRNRVRCTGAETDDDANRFGRVDLCRCGISNRSENKREQIRTGGHYELLVLRCGVAGSDSSIRSIVTRDSGTVMPRFVSRDSSAYSGT